MCGSAVKKLLLMGNPNTGKTTVFNCLTKSSEHVGNWHGVTVEYKAKAFKVNNNEFVLVDLPGLYSLSPNSFEEKVSVDYCLQNPNSLIINVCDINNLRRNLYLTTELLAMGLDVLLVINTMGKKVKLNTLNLSAKLNTKVVLLNTKAKEDIKNLKNAIDTYSYKQNYLKSQEDFFAQKIDMCDEYYLKRKKINAKIDNKTALYKVENYIKNKFKLIDNCLSNVKKINIKSVGNSKLDKFFLNKYLAIPIFFAIMTLIFYLTFFSVGAFLSSMLRNFIQNNIGEKLVSFIAKSVEVPWIIDLVQTGIIGGVGSLFSFLPQVVLLFLFLSILEDSGYISRLAFCFDDVFAKVGLSGKSVYTLLMGFGCSTTACLTARNMSDKNSKIKTAMLAPYMSCSAKLPVYAVIGGAFFGASNVLIVVLLYLLGIIVALALSLILERSFLKSKEQTFIFEFTDYRFPSSARIFKIITENIKLFVIRIGSLLLALNVIIWVLQSFSFDFRFVQMDGGKSILQSLGEIIAPILKPLGFAGWGTASALIAGLVAKEIIVSSIAMFNGVSMGEDMNSHVSQSLSNPLSAVYLTPAGAMSFMVFCLLYSPCIATIATLSKEIGKKWTFISIVMQLGIAYALAMITYLLFNLTLTYGYFKVLICALSLMLIGFCFVYVIKKIKNNNLCENCNNCNKKCKKLS